MVASAYLYMFMLEREGERYILLLVRLMIGKYFSASFNILKVLSRLYKEKFGCF